jgi:hypothetical protein
MDTVTKHTQALSQILAHEVESYLSSNDLQDHEELDVILNAVLALTTYPVSATLPGKRKLLINKFVESARDYMMAFNEFLGDEKVH